MSPARLAEIAAALPADVEVHSVNADMGPDRRDLVHIHSSHDNVRAVEWVRGLPVVEVSSEWLRCTSDSVMREINGRVDALLAVRVYELRAALPVAATSSPTTGEGGAS